MKIKYDTASNLTTNQLIEHQLTIKKAIRLCKISKDSFYYGEYSESKILWHEEQNSIMTSLIVHTLGEIDISINTICRYPRTYFTRKFYLNGIKKDKRILGKALVVITDQIKTKIELRLE